MVKLQAPLPFAVALPSCVDPSYTLTVLLAAALPVNVNVLSFVIPSPAMPVSLEKLVIVGTLVPAVVTVMASAAEAPLALPAASVAVAVKLWPPLGRTAVV